MTQRPVSLIPFFAIAAALAMPVYLRAADSPSNNSSSTSQALSDFPVWKVKGNTLTTDGRPFRIRGINWGWWHLHGTRYSEADMQQLAAWGANTVRLAFSYNDLENDDNPAVWNEEGFQQLDDVAQWGRKYGIHVILDMHVAPGGQDTMFYCAGGHNLLWTDAGAQARFLALWTEIARRYRGRPEVAAYELMNEPETHQKTPEWLRQMDERAITAIRAVDPDKIIVVGGDNGSGSADLDAMKFSDNNILYTFHFYLGAGGNEDWISTVGQDQRISGTQDWVKLEKDFTAPIGSDHMSVLLRSNDNSGAAWFDDVEVKDASGKVLLSSNFDGSAQGYRSEGVSTPMAFDPEIGHDKPGSLKVHGTTGYNGWRQNYVEVLPGQTYHASVWVKLDQATGGTYLAAAFFRLNTKIDPDKFQKKIEPAIEFVRKYQVPVWVGEFGCDAVNPDLQARWVNTSRGLFEQANFSWTYWNDRETSGIKGMGLRPQNKDGSDLPVNQSLLAALQSGWALNKAP